jgi:hypothetical protein
MIARVPQSKVRWPAQFPRGSSAQKGMVEPGLPECAAQAYRRRRISRPFASYARGYPIGGLGSADGR